MAYRLQLTASPTLTKMNKITGLILLIVGIYVCYLGNSRQHSVAGHLDSAAAKVADTMEGGDHTTDATWYYVGGGVLIVIGGASLLRRSAP